MHDFITEIDYLHWQACGKDFFKVIVEGDLLLCDRERLKNLRQRHLHNTKDTWYKRNLWIICHLCMPLASPNKTGRKKSKLWKAQDVEFYY